MEEKQKKHQVSLKDIIIIIIIVVFTILIILFINKMFSRNEDNIELLTNEEIVEVRKFVLNWYLSFDEDEVIEVKVNQLSFRSGQYALTFAVNRVRALYPTGYDLHMTFKYVNYLEFSAINGVTRCTVSYANSGRYSFELK